AAKFLFFFQRFEKSLKVTLAETLRSFALNDLEKERRPVLHRLGKDLQEITFIITVDQDPEPAQWLEIFINVTYSLQHRVIVVRRNLEKLDPALLQIGNRRDDILGRDCDMLDPFAIVKIKILFDLRLLLSFRRFVDRELHKAIAITHDLAHQSGILGRDILVIEAQDVAETHHILIELDPRIHLVPANITDTMVDIL